MAWFGYARDINYYKRYRMELDLAGPLPATPLPPGYAWVPWHDTLLERHSEALYRCFQEEIDAVVFPSLGNAHGCRLLMAEIRRKPGFLPAATWLLAGPDGYCGTVQGVRDRAGLGAIQNVGVTAPHRRRGLGLALVVQAIHGFREAGLARALLEVTARNEAAIRLYQRIGFRKRKTLYKAVDATAAALALIPDV